MADVNPRSKRVQMVYKVRSQQINSASASSSAADDVEQRRHRRNPFHLKYLQAVLTTFQPIRIIDNHGSVSRSQVEAASTNVHVRMELIKTMRENLAKNTSDAVKQYKGSSRIIGPMDSVVNIEDKRPEKTGARESRGVECKKESFYCHSIYEFYLTKFGSYFENLQGKTKKYGNLTSKTGKERLLTMEDLMPINLHTAVPILENQAKDNPNFLQDEDLCFNFDEESKETLESLNRFGPKKISILDLNLDAVADIRIFNKHIKAATKELILDANFPDTEEHQDANLILEEHQHVIHTSISDKVIDITIHIDETSNLNVRGKSFGVQLNEAAVNYGKSFLFTQQTENQNISGGLEQEDVDPIDEFEDYGNSTLEIGQSVVDACNMFSEPTSVVETIDAYKNYMLGPEDFCSSSRSQDSHPGENIHIFLSSKDLVRFRYAKMKQSRKKGQWLVQDMEKLLDVPEHDDNDSDVDCFPEPLLNKIVIHPNIFEESLSRSSSNLISYRKQLQGSCLKIPSALHFAPIDRDQDFESAEVDQDMSDNESSSLIHDYKMSKLPFEDYSQHGPRLRTLCSEVCMSSANWDDIPWSYEETVSKTDTKPEILVSVNKDSVAEIADVLSQSNCIGDIPASGSQEPEDSVLSSIYVTEAPHMQISPEGFPNVMGDLHNCLTKEVASFNSGQGNSIFMDLAGCLEVCSDRCLEIEKSVGDIFKQKRRLVGMECDIDEKDHNRQKQRKRYCLDDLIADVVMTECQFHQKTMFHFDLAPLSLSLADGIFNFYSEECITSVSFKQLLEASKGMIDNEDGRTTMQRYYMALLSLAHQQNIGIFKGQVCGVQIHLRATSSCSLDDIMIYLEPPSIKQDGCVETSPQLV